MPIPKPISGESRGDFLDRCITFLVDEGKPTEQAIAICTQQYEDRDEKGEHLKFLAWKKIDNQREVFISYARNVFYKALRTQLKQYLDSVKQFDKIDLPTELIVKDEPMFEAYRKVYKRVVPVFAQQTYDQMIASVQKRAKPTWDEIIDKWMEGNNTNLISGVTAKTRERIEKQVAIALSEGYGVAKFASELPKEWGFSQKRGELIGRTEIIRASNLGSLEGAIASGIPSKKVWLSTRDGRTRTFAKGMFDHLIMDGQKADELQGIFDVNGEPMLFPADSSLGASPGNTINCRCTIIYEPIEPTFDNNFFL